MEKIMNVNLAPDYQEDGINTEHLSVAVRHFGEEKFLRLVNDSIQHKRYKVAFAFTNVVETLNTHDYQELLLAYHVAEIPNEELNGITIFGLMDIFEVTGFHIGALNQDKECFEFCVGDNPSADWINQIIYNVNHVLIPAVEQKFEKLNVKNYEVTFKISKGY